MKWQGLRWENDNFWWERVRLDELGLPASMNFTVPDKLMHFLTCFGLAWLFSKWMPAWAACLVSFAIMMGPWEMLWDGCFRNGMSWKDMIANTLGCLVFLWWSFNSNIGQSQL